MRARLNIRFLTIAIAAFGALALPTAALAYAPSGDDFVTCTPDPVEAGNSATCSGGLFDPGTTVDGLVTGSTLFSGDLTVAANGTVTFTVPVPADHGAGAATVTLTGDRNGATNVVVGQFDIAAATVEAVEELADTGADAGILGSIAIAAIALGGGALFMSRRNRVSA